MSYTLEQIKNDLRTCDTKQFYMKHIVRSENWYFENVLEIPQDKLIKATDDFRIIVSDAFGVSYNCVMMVGSGKTGYSLSPTKKFKQFVINPSETSKSDIDIAIISQPIFEKFWKIFRDSYDVTKSIQYGYISREIYRGYINERNINSIKQCRIVWQELSNKATRELKQKLYFKHNISYRIYRSWEDFEEYNIETINNLKIGEQ